MPASPSSEGSPFASFGSPARPWSTGIERRLIDGVPVAVTSPARTIVDCFRYRNKVGLDVALEALAEGLRSRKVTIATVDAMASACRARTVLRPYLEAMAWR